MDLAEIVYQLSAKFPANETYRLCSQVTRAAALVPANIAEGNARGSKRDYANFRSVATGSLMETETFLMLAVRLKYISQGEAATAFALLTEISKMLTSLRSRLRGK
jgi:four helix bundle protein